MEKQSAGSIRKTHFLVGMLFTILFIFTAMFISKPISAYADTTLASNSNGKAVNGQEIDSTSTANYLFWAASSERTGILFYIIDNTGSLYGGKKILIMDDPTIYYNASAKPNFKAQLYNAVGVELGDNNLIRLSTPSGYSTKPVEYSDGWHATGNVNTLLTSTTTVGGMEVPYWYKYASYIIGTSRTDEVMKDILNSNSHWTIVAEPVSIQYIYSNSTYNTSGTDTLGHEYSAGDPLPAGSDPDSAEATPTIYCATAKRLAIYQQARHQFPYCSANADNGGTYTYKFLNMALPWSMCLEHEQEVPSYAGGAVANTNTWTPPTGNGERLTTGQIASQSYATGLYFIDVSAMVPPIHTYDEAKGTPGNTETPTTGLTDGECTIQKLYYTQKISTDGTILEEATDYRPYKQTSTTAYISIDTESEYEIEEWKAATSYTTLDSKPTFNSITPTHKGTSSQEILLDQDTGEKYLYILYKKTEVNPNPPQPYDFQLQQSQITKRVSFMAPDANNTTQQLFTHSFTWTAPAPTQTSCTANSNKGHLKCTTSEHTHSDSCYTEDADGNKSLTCTTSEHTHTDSCYEKCSSWQWTDNTTSLGITLDTSTINKAVVSKNDSITYNQPAVNTITTSNKYYKDNTSTRSGTSQNTQSISNFNYITVLFRGQDHLTLADWKNGGAISYLTSLAYDSAYNFKSANTPQGTRKSGTEYNETFATRFINRSPDMSTTYKATVGSAGICSTTSSSYRFDTDFTLNDIVVNDPIGFIFFCTSLEQQTHIKHNHNSSDKINLHVTAMVIFILYLY